MYGLYVYVCACACIFTCTLSHTCIYTHQIERQVIREIPKRKQEILKLLTAFERRYCTGICFSFLRANLYICAFAETCAYSSVFTSMRLQYPSIPLYTICSLPDTYVSRLGRGFCAPNRDEEWHIFFVAQDH